jgi:hypothetical protein
MAPTTEPRAALWLPIFDDLADPIVLARSAAEAEAAGRDGAFGWDHIRRRAPVAAVADPRPYAEAGATWLLTEFDPEDVDLGHVRGVLRDGPAR